MGRALALLLIMAGCYKPYERDCAVRCATDEACPDGFSCGSDGFCHSAGHQERCGDPPGDAEDLDPDGPAGDGIASDSMALDGPAPDQVGILTVDLSVAASNDDALEDPPGPPGNSQVLPLHAWTSLYDSAHWGGSRFVLPVPRGAAIVNAWLEVRVDSVSEDDADCVIWAEATGNAQPFAAIAGSLSVRPRGTRSLRWTMGALGKTWARSPSVSALVQEVVDRGDWASGNGIVFIWNQVSGPLRFEWRTHDFDVEGEPDVAPGTYAPRLHVEYMP